MKLYARRTASKSQKVLWFLGELGLDHEFIATGGDAGGLDAPDNVARWYRARTQRDAYREHVMLPFDELKRRLRP